MPPVVERGGFRYFELPNGYAAAITIDGVTHWARDYQTTGDGRLLEPSPGQLVAALVAEGKVR